MDARKFQFAEPAALSRAQRLAASELVTQALPQYYAPVLRASEAGKDILADLLGFPAGTTDNTVVALEASGTVAGIVSGIATNALQRAQLSYMQSLFRRLDESQREAMQIMLADMSHQTQAIESDGWYLAGISVSPGSQGSGLADMLMEIFYAQSPHAVDYSLHVHRDNARAISFYRKHGFDLIDNEAGAVDHIVYRAMRRMGGMEAGSVLERGSDG